MDMVRLRRDDVVWSDLGGEIVILDLRSSTYFSARASGAVLVSTLVQGASADRLVDEIVARYDTTAATARADVKQFLDELARRDLLEPVEA